MKSIGKISIFWFVCILSSFCSGPSAEEENSSSGTLLNSCRQSFTDQQVESNLRISHDLNRSLHELVACGNLTFEVMKSFSTIVRGFITGETASIPSQIEFSSDIYNVYAENQQEPMMAIGFQLKKNTTFGEQGELITGESRVLAKQPR